MTQLYSGQLGVAEKPGITAHSPSLLMLTSPGSFWPIHYDQP